MKRKTLNSLKAQRGKRHLWLERGRDNMDWREGEWHAYHAYPPRHKFICWACRVTAVDPGWPARDTNVVCSRCRQPMQRLASRARIPRQTASKRRWQQFKQMFGKQRAAVA